MNALMSHIKSAELGKYKKKEIKMCFDIKHPLHTEASSMACREMETGVLFFFFFFQFHRKRSQLQAALHIHLTSLSFFPQECVGLESRASVL